MAKDIPMSEVKSVKYKNPATGAYEEINALNVAGCKWRKPYTLYCDGDLSAGDGIDGIEVYRSPQSNCDQVDWTIREDSIESQEPILFGDEIEVQVRPASGYKAPEIYLENATGDYVESDEVVRMVANGNMILEIHAGSLIQTYLSAPYMIDVYLDNPGDTVDCFLTVKNPNAIAVTIHISFVDRNGVVNGALSTTMRAGETREIQIPSNSSGWFADGWYADAYFTASGFDRSEYSMIDEQGVNNGKQ